MSESPVSSEQRYRLLFEQNMAGVYCTTLEGKILDCSESMASMLGYASREEVLALRAQDLYCELSDREEFLARLRKTGVLTNSELRLRRKDGSPIDILENVQLLPDEHGRCTIIQGTMIDITERKRVERELQESERRARALADKLRRLTQHLQGVREGERTRIARELHDELGQALTVLNMDLHWLRGRAGRDEEAARARIESMCDLVNRTIQSVRRICADLHPTILDDFGLAAAIEWHAREFEARTGIICTVEAADARLNVPGDQATAVFRILQESLTNVARHARATQVHVCLRVDREALVLTIADNGAGISPRAATDAGSFGLAGMRERALRWGGVVQIDGMPGRGTTVTLRMPLGASSGEAPP